MKRIFSIVTIIVLFAFMAMAAGPHPGKQFGEDLGKDDRSYKDLFLKNKIIFEGATANDFEISLVPAFAAADATVTIPAKTGTIKLLTQTITAKIQTDSPVSVAAADSGQIYTNAGAGGAVVFNLPEASTVIGQSFTFVVIAAQNLDVNPADADVILGATNAAGDALRNAVAGGSITLTVIDATNIVVTGINGSWADVN